MSIILNEVKYAEQILSGEEPANKPYATLTLLGKYYRQKVGLKPMETITALNDFMVSHYNDYNPDSWEEVIEKIAKSKKYLIRELDHIEIMQTELDCIALIDDLNLQKIMFTMLCYAKFYNAINPQNNNWINTDIAEIFKIARVNTRCRKDKLLILNKLLNMAKCDGEPYISLSKKNTNTNVKLNFLDMSGKPVLQISDFRELGYAYLQYLGKEQFTHCEKCSLLIKKGKRRPKYCSNCAKNINREKTRQRMQNLRA